MALPVVRHVSVDADAGGRACAQHACYSHRPGRHDVRVDLELISGPSESQRISLQRVRLCAVDVATPQSSHLASQFIAVETSRSIGHSRQRRSSREGGFAARREAEGPRPTQTAGAHALHCPPAITTRRPGRESLSPLRRWPSGIFFTRRHRHVGAAGRTPAPSMDTRVAGVVVPHSPTPWAPARCCCCRWTTQWSAGERGETPLLRREVLAMRPVVVGRRAQRAMGRRSARHDDRVVTLRSSTAPVPWSAPSRPHSRTAPVLPPPPPPPSSPLTAPPPTSGVAAAGVLTGGRHDGLRAAPESPRARAACIADPRGAAAAGRARHGTARPARCRQRREEGQRSGQAGGRRTGWRAGALSARRRRTDRTDDRTAVFVAVGLAAATAAAAAAVAVVAAAMAVVMAAVALLADGCTSSAVAVAGR